MKIVVFGGTGMIGQRIVKEALDRGHTVTAVARDPSKLTLSNPHLETAKGDATDADSVAQIARGNDVIVSAVGPDHQLGNYSMLVDAAHALLDGVKRAGVKRLIVVGGAGTLEAAPGVRRMDMPDFPAAWKPSAQAGADSLDVYRRERELDWTFQSPADMIAPGTRTGKYRTDTERLVRAPDGQSHISAEDYAVALLDEAERPHHLKERFTVGY